MRATALQQLGLVEVDPEEHGWSQASGALLFSLFMQGVESGKRSVKFAKTASTKFQLSQQGDNEDAPPTASWVCGKKQRSVLSCIRAMIKTPCAKPRPLTRTLRNSFGIPYYTEFCPWFRDGVWSATKGGFKQQG